MTCKNLEKVECIGNWLREGHIQKTVHGAAIQSTKTGMQYRKLSAAIGSSQLELVKLPAGFGLMAMTFKLGPKAMSLGLIHGSVATVATMSSMVFPGQRLMSRPTLGTLKVISARPTIFFIQIHQKQHDICRSGPPNQLTLHDLATKKRKRDDFHDELVTRFDKTTFQRYVVQWITDANLTFRVPEHKGLQKVFQYLNSLVHETSANLTHETVRARIIDEFNTYKSRVIHTLSRSPSQVHIAFDDWASRNRHSFFSINAFFLDEDTFQPRKIVLDLPNVTMAHTGENISAAVMEVLDDFELIANNKVGYIILDNAASNEGAVEAIGH
ncbi:hypothetical protein HZ326_26698 [Fusarium oxysporum f. sp. albedinis]|nr:hypothetical protein HZ326_26698 [Fusarium oxysporum f. sp. albedinis]